MNAARRTMLSVFTAAGLSGALLTPSLTPSLTTLAYGVDDPRRAGGDLPVGGVGTPPGSDAPVGADQREIRTRQRLLQASLDNVPAAPPPV